MQKPPPPAAASSSVEDFVRAVIRSGLLDHGELQTARAALPPDRVGDPEALADHLVRTGRLSRFQARKLLEGTPLGLVLGPFQVLAPIGKGGMGTVYLARDSRNQQLLALKVLPPKRAREEGHLLARFLREMAICQRVAHPHLTRTYEAGVCQGVYYIAMEYIPGRTLHRVVAAEGPLALARAARLFAEVAWGLEYAHRQGLIHRDLKPSNVLVTPNDHAKVLDLGLALVEGEVLTNRAVAGGPGYVVGTMDYIAPEQGEDPTGVDPRSDIYSLGCTLYFALTGQPPFAGGTTREKIQRHRTVEPIPVEIRNRAIPPAFAAVLRRMMAKRPEDRFASAAELREALVRWATGERVLPLDRAGDSVYQRAVAAIEAAEPTPEQVWQAIVQTPGDTPPPSHRLSAPTFAELAPDPDAGAPRLELLIPAAVGALVVLGLGLTGLVLLLGR
jgi:serine/threonine protein kinase